MQDLFGNTVTTNEVIHYLTWHPPFGPLMLHGKKETRSFYTNVRGKVLILSSGKPYNNFELFEMCGPDIMLSIYHTLKDEPTKDMNGMAIAIGTLVNCYPMKPNDEQDCFVKYKEPWSEPTNEDKTEFVEKRLWIWQFKNVARINPFKFKGKQGWGIIQDPSIVNKIQIINPVQ